MEKSVDDVSNSCELKQADRVAELPGQPQMDEGPKLTALDAKRYIKVVESRLTREKYVEFHGILQEFREHSIDVPGVKMKLMKLFNRDEELLLGLNIFLPEDSQIILTQEDEPNDPVIQLVQHIKMRLQDENHIYISFLSILNLYRMGKLSANEVHKKVADLFQDHQDLITEFTNFLPQSHANSIGIHNTRNEHSSSSLTKKRRFWSKEETMASHTEDVEIGGQPNPNHGKAFAKCHEKGKRKRSTTGGKLKLGSKRSTTSIKDKHKAKLSQDLDLSTSESCNPSYKLVPRDCPKLPKANQRKTMDDEVLNDHWVSVIYEKEGHSFKPLIKNQYKEILFQHEDDRFELDMGIECITLTIKQAEELMERIDKKIYQDKQCQGLRFITNIYDDYGHDMVNELRKNVSSGLPVILIRMKQKQEEWIMFYLELDKLSRQIFVENHQLSLDHHGFYLKQQDEKILRDTVLLAEINKISEANSKEDNSHQVPHLDFKYYDLYIHGDFFKLIKVYGSGIFSSKQLEDVLKIWTCLVEPLFGFVQIVETSNDNYHEFVTNEVDLFSLVDLEKGGFVACMGDRMKVDNTTEDVGKQNYHDKHQESDLGKDVGANNLHVFYGDDAFYIFFRLHHELYSRLQEAKQSTSEKWQRLNDTTCNDSNAIFLDFLHNYLVNREKYEYECRTSFVTRAGLIYSIARLISKLSRQLLAIANNEVDNKLLDLFVHEKSREPGSFVEEVYIEKASMIVNGNKKFRFEHLLIPDTEGQNRLTISHINLYERKTRSSPRLYDMY
ncbi:paired amphipathic helix protein Sin3-like 6 [Lactuca sativa]|uniref:paired amphipathic helix protein Sin3-like 6 n=1 Tax=Lactuca sativa TaxID=4236 RepID=UPI0022AF0E8D|nr:paired amphipathic helix protein Sin3-like 6 [Lactuca sativa]